ncbi:MAG: YceI family protein [Omnitrophica bacterium]|nr:YceI family protein [Candidatus Omnitrophota bacterium]
MGKRQLVILTAILVSVLSLSNISLAGTYKIDPTHSTFGFAITHMKVGTTRGVFTDYKGEVHFDAENPGALSGWVIINAGSIDTRLEARDKHLKGRDFFDVENYPTILFRIKKLVRKGDDYEILGDLTMRGIRREVSGPAFILGPVTSPFGGEVIGLSGWTVINRRDFGISWNDKMPDGGFVVGDEVKIIIDIEADKK